jgi:hypothetical protein
LALVVAIAHRSTTPVDGAIRKRMIDTIAIASIEFPPQGYVIW